MYKISDLSKHYKLSRSTLLYYDKINLLRPSMRNNSNYRLYSKSDLNKLERICSYRELGIPLLKIKTILEKKNSQLTEILEDRLIALNKEIKHLREQQRLILQLLGNRKLVNKVRSIDKSSWVKILKETGLSAEEMKKWHYEFEKFSGEAHQDFLESLGINPTEIKKIREWSK